MKTSATNRRIRVLLTALRDRKLIPRPDFQRRLVWSNKHKVAFVQTVLLGYPFPEIYVASGDVNADTGESTEMLVDGQQRIDTLYQYFTGSPELSLGSDLRPYASFHNEEKLAFLEYEVVVRDLGNTPLPEIKEVFLRINSTNYAVNAIEIHNARYMGEFKQFGEDLAEHPFFAKHGIFSPTDIKRMQDLRFILVLAATMLSTYFNRDDELEEFLWRYNDSFPEKLTLGHEMEQLLSFIDECDFPPDSRVWKKADLFTLIVELHRLMFRNGCPLSPRDARNSLVEFYERVDDATEPLIDRFPHRADEIAEYRKAAIQATNDRGNRIRRGDVIADVLRGNFFGTGPKSPQVPIPGLMN